VRHHLFVAVAASLFVAGCSPIPSREPTPTTALYGPSGSSAPTVAASSSSSVPPPASSDWPTYHRDQARTGNDPAFPAPGQSLTQRWSAPLDGAVYAEPPVVGGRVIAATEGGSVYALDPGTGRIAWRRTWTGRSPWRRYRAATSIPWASPARPPMIRRPARSSWSPR
jgi:outer membrane protein assembly factor BamB